MTFEWGTEEIVPKLATDKDIMDTGYHSVVTQAVVTSSQYMFQHQPPTPFEETLFYSNILSYYFISKLKGVR